MLLLKLRHYSARNSVNLHEDERINTKVLNPEEKLFGHSFCKIKNSLS